MAARRSQTVDRPPNRLPPRDRTPVRVAQRESHRPIGTARRTAATCASSPSMAQTLRDMTSQQRRDRTRSTTGSVDRSDLRLPQEIIISAAARSSIPAGQAPLRQAEGRCGIRACGRAMSVPWAGTAPAATDETELCGTRRHGCQDEPAGQLSFTTFDLLARLAWPAASSARLIEKTAMYWEEQAAHDR